MKPLLPCWLSADCSGLDELEHYATCEEPWLILERHICSCTERSLSDFFLLDAECESQDLDELIVRATHVYAVRAAFNSRKSEGVRQSREAIPRLIKAGYKTAMAHSGK
eukprot:4782614-Karenia_brevis.AAC.1